MLCLSLFSFFFFLEWLGWGMSFWGTPYSGVSSFHFGKEKDEAAEEDEEGKGEDTC